MPRAVHPEDGMVFACPHCDEAGEVYRRTRFDNTEIGGDSTFVCHRCDDGREGFRESEVVARETREGGAEGVARPRSDAAKALLDADPDAVGGEQA